MFDLHSLSIVLFLLKASLGVCILAQLPIFLFKLLTGRCSFSKGGSAARSAARAVMPEAEWAQAAFEEVGRSAQSQHGCAGATPGVADRQATVLVTIATDRSYKVDIPDYAFEPIDAGR